MASTSRSQTSSPRPGSTSTSTPASASTLSPVPPPDNDTDDLFQKVKAKQEWVKQMRLKFSVRPDVDTTKNIIFQDGSLNQENSKVDETRKWTEKERELLIQGIKTYGIGNFGKISDELLQKWSTNELRLKTVRLIGRQNLQIYKDQCWKGDANDITREYERNKAIGLKLGQWKQGVLVYDDDGLVLAEVLKTEPTSNEEEEANDEEETYSDANEDVEMDAEEEDNEELEERFGREIQSSKKRRK